MPAALLVWLNWMLGDVAQTRHWIDELDEPSIAKEFALRMRDWPRYRELFRAQVAEARLDPSRANLPRQSNPSSLGYINHLTIICLGSHARLSGLGPLKRVDSQAHRPLGGHLVSQAQWAGSASGRKNASCCKSTAGIDGRSLRIEPSAMQNGTIPSG